MTHSAIRQQLHHYIDTADDKKIEAIYTILENDLVSAADYGEEELTMLHERASKYLKGEGKTYSVKEVHDNLRGRKKKNEL